MLVFGEENQGGLLWSLLCTLDGPGADPTVWFREDDNGFRAWADATHRNALAPLEKAPIEWDRFDD
ncbi:hypothetical protein [Streptomyces sp. N50]|uniref:hypothetical protein n=1 Tax=Streptomyces sp. N50 TaxID=3081765 RepID=UPI0029620DC3|nr:hypothetical protein [Streptomyces sp. N50]WOX12158.1 hypothetical protein R2B38_26480 [Streptomyces sp. N50]